MAMILDVDYVLQAIRLSALRNSDDPLLPRIVSLDPSFALNPYINASGLSDIDRWPEIKRALDSPPLEAEYSSSNDESSRHGRRGGALQYTQTIMGPGRSGGAGMRVTGRKAQPGESSAVGRRAQATKYQRANSSSAARNPMVTEPMPKEAGAPKIDGGFFSSSGRPRADSAPMPMHLGLPGTNGAPAMTGTSMMNPARLGVGGVDSGAGLLEQAMSFSGGSEDVEETDRDETEEGARDFSNLGLGRYDPGESSTGAAESARPSDMGITAGESAGPLGQAIIDEGSDVDETEFEEDMVDALDQQDDGVLDRRKGSAERRSSGDTMNEAPLDFAPITLNPRPQTSALTAILKQHIPHLVSTASAPSMASISNPFTSLYASVSAPSAAPSVSLELYFPHSSEPTDPLRCKVRKDATVEEATGYGLFKYWEDGREPRLSEEEGEERWSTVGWGLRIVEDDGEVDEDFPPLDRDSQVSKFSYGQFAIVTATDAQTKQNIAKASHIQRRPSRVIAAPNTSRPLARARPSFTQQPGGSMLGDSFGSLDQLNSGSMAMKGSVGLSSALSKPVLLRVRVTASADVHFTTTISVPRRSLICWFDRPSDMYIADLTEVLCKKKRLQSPASDWVLCLADLTLALPLDRTVASLEGRTDLALVKRQWAVEHGLRIGDRRGGDPSASIFKRVSEPAPLAKYGAGLADLSQTYKKYIVQRKIAIGRHERVLAIDGDYIHIMPSESRAFFDSMKTTSFHITLVASCKLTGRAGGFKINVWREGGQKRYEFEAENRKQAADIISSIRQLRVTQARQRFQADPVYRMKAYQTARGSTRPPVRMIPRR